MNAYLHLVFTRGKMRPGNYFFNLYLLCLLVTASVCGFCPKFVTCSNVSKGESSHGLSYIQAFENPMNVEWFLCFDNLRPLIFTALELCYIFYQLLFSFLSLIKCHVMFAYTCMKC